MNLKIGRNIAAAVLLTSLVACANIGAAPGIWVFNVGIQARGCVDDFSYNWGNDSAINLRGERFKQYCGSGGAVASESYMPKGLFRVEWTNSHGEHIERRIDMQSALQGYDPYGGRLSVVVTQSSAQVWLEEPDKRGGYRLVYPHKEKKMIFETK